MNACTNSNTLSVSGNPKQALCICHLETDKNSFQKLWVPLLDNSPSCTNHLHGSSLSTQAIISENGNQQLTQSFEA
jgi:hypothetical protein